MKNLIFVLACFLSFSVFGQSKKEIIQQQEVQITELSNLNSSLQQKVNSLKSEMKQKLITKQGEIDDLKKELNKNLISTPDEFGESIFKIIKYRDFNQLYRLCLHLNDTIQMSQEQLITIRRHAEDITEFEETVSRKMDNLHTDGISIGINWVKSEVISVIHDGIDVDDDFTFLSNLTIRFKSMNKVYLIIFDDILLLNKEWKLIDDDWRVVDVAEKAKQDQERLEEKARQEKQAEIDFLNSPFTPRGLNMGSATYSYKDQTIVEFDLRITNDTEFTFKKIVYYLYIKNSKGTKIYGSTHTLSRSIEPRDVITITVPDLYNLFVGEDVSENHWDWGVDVIDCLPRQK